MVKFHLKMENYPETNKSLLKIFDSILHDDLRPHGSQVQKGFFLNPKIPNGIRNPETVKEFEKGLIVFFSFKPEILSQVYFFSEEKEFEDIKNNNKCLFEKFKSNIDISFPQHFSVTTEFFYFFITNEAIRSFIGIKYLVLKTPEREKKISLLQIKLLEIPGIITKAVLRIIHPKDYLSRFDIGEPEEQLSKNYFFSYSIMILALVRLYYEIIYSFKELVGDMEKSVYELVSLDLKFFENEKLKREINFGILWLKVKDLVESENFNIEEAFKLLTELYKQKENEIYWEKRNAAIAALENRLLLREWQGELGMEKFSSSNFADRNFNEIYEKYQEEIEKQESAMEQVKKARSLILNLKLTFEGLLPEEVVVKNSIPQRLLAELEKEKELYHNTFKVSAKIPPISNYSNGDVDKAEQELIIKNKEKAREYLKYFSGINRKGNRIMRKDDFERLLNYVDILIETKQVPQNLEPIPQIDLDNQFISYTFYSLHLDLYGKRGLTRTIWPEFVRLVFLQLKDNVTIYSKFHTKPKNYDFVRDGIRVN